MKVYAEQAIQLSKKLAYRKGEANGYNNLGDAYLRMGDFGNALKNLEISLSLTDTVNDKKGVVYIYLSTGSAFLYMGNYPEALKMQFNAFRFAKADGNKSGLVSAYIGLGTVYDNQCNYPEALKYYDLASRLMIETKELSQLCYTYYNSGLIYIKQNRLNDAIKCFFQGLAISKKFNNEFLSARIMLGIAEVKSKNGEYDVAKLYCDSSLLEMKVINNEYEMATVYNVRGLNYLAASQYKLAYSDLNKALTLGKNLHNWPLLKTTYEGLSQIDSVTGNFKGAYYNYKMYKICVDSLHNAEASRILWQVQLQNSFDQKVHMAQIEQEKKDVIAQKELQNQRMIRNCVIVGFLLLLLLTFVLFRSYRLKQRSHNEITLQKLIIEEKHKEITDSINYAERIQRSFLASQQFLDANLNEYFIFFKPKQVVSGDFYWAGSLINGNFAFVTADSTGHGVPGAIMSILNITCLENAIKEESEPAQIFNHTRRNIIEHLRKDGSPDGGKDGMDASIIVIDKTRSKVTIVSANNPVWIIRNNELTEIIPDRMPIGKHDNQDISFKQHEVHVQNGDLIYTLTDGFADQFGGSKGKKFMTKNLRKLLADNANLPMKEQYYLLQNTFDRWIGSLEQVDDVTVVGIKLLI